MVGIYRITNILNGKVYIGQSVISAATSVNGNHANISKALNNQIKSAYGFKWKYWAG